MWGTVFRSRAGSSGDISFSELFRMVRASEQPRKPSGAPNKSTYANQPADAMASGAALPQLAPTVTGVGGGRRGAPRRPPLLLPLDLDAAREEAKVEVLKMIACAEIRHAMDQELYGDLLGGGLPTSLGVTSTQPVRAQSRGGADAPTEPSATPAPKMSQVSLRNVSQQRLPMSTLRKVLAAERQASKFR